MTPHNGVVWTRHPTPAGPAARTSSRQVSPTQPFTRCDHGTGQVLASRGRSHLALGMAGQNGQNGRDLRHFACQVGTSRNEHEAWRVGERVAPEGAR
jgi:hypothetical protein